MSDLIKIKGGSLGRRVDMPKLSDCELGYVKDKKELHIGTPDGNVKLCGADDGYVFYAIYQSSTLEEVRAAYDAGKIVACILPDDHKILYLVSIWDEGCVFSGFVFGGITVVELQGATWYEPEVITIPREAPAEVVTEEPTDELTEES